ncbi:MAG: NADH-quinone oxidoreductase subunit M [Propionibacteriaceae bacterium]|jgi:NADH-quinone oxidoreductase subunit M|nr:NADH-quinone oxidoreductase subunit M [Propionibacteriaceae bacterium]
MVLPLLSILAVLPIIGAIALFPLRTRDNRVFGFWVSLVTLAVAVACVVINRSTDLSEQVAWIRPLGAWYAMSLDGLSSVMVLVTCVLTTCVLGVGVPAAVPSQPEQTVGDADPGRPLPSGVFTPLVLGLQGLALFTFMASDLIMFTLVFEATLIPAFFLIGGWGSIQRGAAAVKFLLFGLAGGFLLLAGAIALGLQSATIGRPSMLFSQLAELDIPAATARPLFIVLFLAFALKAPLVPLHGWLPSVVEHTSPQVAVLLVGILDAVGPYGMIRLCLGVMGDEAKWASPVLLIVALVSVIYGALAALSERHLTRLVALTSVGHSGLIVFGIFAMSPVALTGAILYIFAHSLSAAALLLCAAFVAERTGTLAIGEFGGLARKAPVLAGLFLFAGLATLSLPGTANFAGEFSVIVGAFASHPWQAAVAIFATLLAAAYVLVAYQRVFTGPLRAEHANVVDVIPVQKWAVGVLIALLLAVGVFPRPLVQLADEASTFVMTQIGVAAPDVVVPDGAAGADDAEEDR